MATEPIFANVRSYSGVQRSGMSSDAGVSVDRTAIAHRQGLNHRAGTSTVPNNEFNRRARVFQRAEAPAVRAAAAQRAVLRDPGLNQMPLHARQQDLAVVQRQVKRIEDRIGVAAATPGNFVGLPRSIGAGQFDRHPPFHFAPGLPPADVSTPMFGTVSTGPPVGSASCMKKDVGQVRWAVTAAEHNRRRAAHPGIDPKGARRAAPHRAPDRQRVAVGIGRSRSAGASGRSRSRLAIGPR